MVDDSEITDLSEIYGEMDANGKEKMVWMAKRLLSVQLIGKEGSTETSSNTDKKEAFNGTNSGS
jgi:hypothetical protein